VTNLVDHLESFLGPISGGSRGDDTTPPGVAVVWFGEDTPFSGVTTLATLGLSDHHLHQSEQRGLHQELLLHLPMVNQPANAAGVLFHLAAELIGQERGLLRGEVVGPRAQLFAGYGVTALYAAVPVYLPAGFATCPGQPPIVLTWLIPITDAEAGYVRVHGWRALEAAFGDEEPDLTNIHRESVHVAVTDR
jgi:hypothetical protein